MMARSARQIVCYPGGGLGDNVIALPWLYALTEIYPGIQLDFITQQNPHAIEEIYADTGFLGMVMPYDLAAGVDPLMESYELYISVTETITMASRPGTSFPELMDQVGLAKKNVTTLGQISQMGTHGINQLARLAAFRGLNRYTLPFYSFGLTQQNFIPPLHLRPEAMDVCTRHGLTPGKYVTFSDGWDLTPPLQPGQRPTKAWRHEHWIEFVAQFKQQNPGIQIVQLGAPKTGQLVPGVDLNLVGKTNLREVFVLLKHARLHVDIEGGLVHMAHAVGTKSVVLFGPTNLGFFGYPENRNLSSACTDCWWLTRDWMPNCVRGLPVPECMVNHRPENVAAIVTDELSKQAPLAATTVQENNARHRDENIAVVGDAALADQLTATNKVTHYCKSGQKNVHVPIDGMRYPQFAGNLYNLAVRAGEIDVLYGTVSESYPAFQVQEALRAVRVGGKIYLRGFTADLWQALQSEVANLPQLQISQIPVAGDVLCLTRTA